ncbi:MAG: hypothetical protein LW875_02230 [Proteobacteria bacterium]|nr:hypothetical protein [Pseudomonadota bacterium]
MNRLKIIDISLSLFCLFGLANLATAAEDTRPDLIEVHYNASALTPYRERASSWSIIAQLQARSLKPENYRSRIGGETFQQSFGDHHVIIPTLSIGSQYNTSMGGFSLEGSYGVGSIESERIGARRLALSQYGLSATIVLDKLMPEPLFAPYFTGEVFVVSWEESDATTTVSGENSFALGYRLGILFQLNSLDSGTALVAFNSSGLENTYLDIFASQTNTSNSSSDVQLKSPMTLGAGIRLQF